MSVSTRIAILADTHLSDGIARLPAACVELVRGADLAIHAGDFSKASVLRELGELGTPLHGVHGNVDDAEMRRLLPERCVIEAGPVRIGLIHDAGPRSGRLERMRLAFPDADAVVFGHSHMPLLESEGGFSIFNPGSPTQRRRAPHRTVGVATVDGGEIRFEHVEIPQPKPTPPRTET